ncbi:protein-disulfide reductase DsbD [bacterium]|nr:protein-disulfide reductase DsbD [bacterium]
MKKVALLFWGIIFIGRLAAQEPVPVILQGSIEPQVVAIGSEGTLLIQYDIDPAFHIGDVEAGFFKLEAEPLSGWTFQDAIIPESHETAYGGEYSGIIKVVIPFKVGNEAFIGESTITVNVTYQPCSEEGICYPPEDEVLRIKAVIEPGQTIDSGSIADRLTRALETGSIVAFLIVFLGGFLTSFTPCVYPMIPITIAVIGAQAGENKLKGFVLSLFYVLGLATMFSSLGIIAAKTGSLFGSIAQHPIAVALIGGIFLFMGLSMLGFYTVRVPSGIQTKLQGKKRSGFFGAYLTGIVAGVVVSPCVSPLLVVILTWVAKTGSMALGVGLLFSFALGLGVLFILIGTFSGILKSLPKTGGWMEVVEHSFGILLVGLALFFVRPLFSPEIYKGLWGGVLIIFATFGGVFSVLAADANSKTKFGKSITLIALILGAGLLVSVVLNNPGISAGSSGAVQVTESGHALPDGWFSSEAEALEIAKEEGRPLMIDFWADWCAACHELDERTWPDASVKTALADFVIVKIDQTKNGDAEKILQKKYGVVGLPTVIYLSSAGEELARFEGYQSPAKVEAIITKAKSMLK